MSVATDSQTITILEKNYLKKERKQIYISLEDLGDDEWVWDEFELRKFRKLWREDISILSIARILKRSETSVLLLSLDQIDKSLIKPRPDWKIR